MFDLVKIIIRIFSSFILATLSCFFFLLLLSVSNPEIVENKIYQAPDIFYVTINDSSDEGMLFLAKKNTVEFIHLYMEKEGISHTVASVIINTAIKYEIPINLAFALAYTESRYNPKAYNYGNNNGSFDYGLFQLNCITFPDTEINIDPRVNADLALRYLKSNYNDLGSYHLALVAYNAGFVHRYNPHTKRYVKLVLEKQKELDEWFKNDQRDKILRGLNKGQVFTTSG